MTQAEREERIAVLEGAMRMLAEHLVQLINKVNELAHAVNTTVPDILERHSKQIKYLQGGLKDTQRTMVVITECVTGVKAASGDN